MSDFYRKKSGAFFSFLRRRGIYIAVVVLLAGVVCIAYFKLRGRETADDMNLVQNNSDTPRITLSPNKPEPEPTSAENVTKAQLFKAPVECAVSQPFSGSVPVFSEIMKDWRLHQGVDYRTETPMNVTAAADGIVEDVYTDGVMGKTVVVEHADGTRTVYQSLDDEVAVIRGQNVLCGDLIGRTGNSAVAESDGGVHLHFAVIRDGAYIDPKEILK